MVHDTLNNKVLRYNDWYDVDESGALEHWKVGDIVFARNAYYCNPISIEDFVMVLDKQLILSLDIMNSMIIDILGCLYPDYNL